MVFAEWHFFGNVISVKGITAFSEVFQIFYAVAGFITILMVNLLAGWACSDKLLGHQHMQVVATLFAVFKKTNLDVSIRSSTANGEEFAAAFMGGSPHILNAPQVRHGIQSVVPSYRFPFFNHGGMVPHLRHTRQYMTY